MEQNAAGITNPGVTECPHNEVPGRPGIRNDTLQPKFHYNERQCSIQHGQLTVKCIEQNSDIMKSPYIEHDPEASFPI